MPFGLTNAPATFQSAMNELFRPYLWKFVLVFFNDILVYITTWAEHLQQVNMVLDRLQKQQWVANRKKSEFGETSIREVDLRVGAHGGGNGDPALAATFVGSKRITTQAQQHWISKLLGYDFETVFRTGTTNKVADALSRKEGTKKHNLGMEKELKGMMRPYWKDFQEVVKEEEEDEDLKKIMADITRIQISTPHSRWRMGDYITKEDSSSRPSQTGSRNC
ncbi:uncharacterized protein LOC124834927 [Vigna umbellata]|uniref:uncharacterized protein LOC124834927 n=1 Tax=Vigna umbellata TaxID=87088 RepID=UPI001F5FBAE5|nr:uncharacterized protein LOC124834927 [Vigna umbellata]